MGLSLEHFWSWAFCQACSGVSRVVGNGCFWLCQSIWVLRKWLAWGNRNFSKDRRVTRRFWKTRNVVRFYLWLVLGSYPVMNAQGVKARWN